MPRAHRAEAIQWGLLPGLWQHQDDSRGDVFGVFRLWKHLWWLRLMPAPMAPSDRQIHEHIRLVVRDIARAQELTHRELGEIMGCSRDSIRQRLSRNSRWQLSELWRLARHLKVSVDNLLPRRDE